MSQEHSAFSSLESNPQLKQGMMDYWQVQKEFTIELNDKVLEACLQIPEFVPIIKGMSPELIEKNRLESLERSRKAFEQGEWGAYFSHLAKEGETYARAGLGFAPWVELIRKYKDVVQPFVLKKLEKDQNRVLGALNAMNELMYVSVEVIGKAYLSTKEQVIRGQEAAIRELSTPVLKVRERLLILPLVGIVDTQRARQVTESMLHAIRDHRAKAVVMDITGVPMVDSKVANHLVQSVEAARLMGSTVIITGLSPEIAQTLVALGAELPNVKTFGDLQGGMEEAEAILGLEVKVLPPSRTARDGAESEA